MSAIDVLILSNGPGEVTTWVRPAVTALRQRLGDTARISLVLSPCPNASGKEVDIAKTFPEIDRIQSAEHFFPFLLWGKTAAGWDWHNRGVVVFLGGDQIYPVIIAKRLGYRSVIYAEWDARWHRWVDRFATMNAELAKRSPRYAQKFTVVGDLMADVPRDAAQPDHTETELVGLLPGSKPMKLAQGVPLLLAIAEHLQAHRPQTRFAIPVAPTLEPETLVRFADANQNPVAHHFGAVGAQLHPGPPLTLQTPGGLVVPLWTDYPAYDLLSQCRICLTTVGANTAELGALGVPMLVVLPTQQLDAMRAWDGLPGLLANLPGVGTGFAKLINYWFLRKKRLLAWPNIWAGEAIVPELIGELNPEAVALQVANYLEHPETLETMRSRLRQVRGESGAALRLAEIVAELCEPGS